MRVLKKKMSTIDYPCLCSSDDDVDEIIYIENVRSE